MQASETLNTILGGGAGGVAGTMIGKELGGDTGALVGAALGAAGGAATANRGNKNELRSAAPSVPQVGLPSARASVAARASLTAPVSVVPVAPPSEPGPGMAYESRGDRYYERQALSQAPQETQKAQMA